MIWLLLFQIIAPLIALVLIAGLWSENRELRRKINTAEKAFAEVVSGAGKREAGLLTQMRKLRADLDSANADADRLAPIVEQYVKDMDSTAALLKDDQPPALAAERESLRLHAELLKLRTHAPTQLRQEIPPDEKIR